MSYEVYRHKNATDADFTTINEIYKRVMSEDKALCDLAQKNVNAGVFINGMMHPRMEKGPLYFQKLCRDAVQEHHNKEKAVKHEIWPARQELSAESQEDEDFCTGLACSPDAEKLEW